MLQFIPLFKKLLTEEYPDGIDPRTLHQEFFPELSYTDIEIGILELSGSGYVKRGIRQIQATPALYESEIHRLQSQQQLQLSLEEHRDIHIQIIMLEEYLQKLHHER